MVAFCRALTSSSGSKFHVLTVNSTLMMHIIMLCSYPDEDLVFKYAPWALNKNESLAATVSDSTSYTYHAKLHLCT